MHRPLPLFRTALGFALTGATAGAQVGTPFCNATLNSTGNAGVLTAYGSADINRNDLALTATQLLPNTFCMFVVSQTQGSPVQPPNSSGNICLGGAIGRYSSNTLSSTPNGPAIMSVIDTAIPSPSQTYAVTPGMTLNFQAWHRDLLGTSNFTSGISVPFYAHYLHEMSPSAPAIGGLARNDGRTQAEVGQ